MKKSTQYSLTLAIASLISAPAVLAEEPNGIVPPPTHGATVNKTLTKTVDIDVDAIWNNNIDVDIKKDLSTTKRIFIRGSVEVKGKAAAVATIDDKQINFKNKVINTWARNTATIDKNALQNASGNLQTNVGAGDNNQQKNALALAVQSGAYKGYYGGISDAEVFELQDGQHNYTLNYDVTNDAKIKDNALKNAVGNVQTNVAAGVSNQQSNNFAVAVTKDSTLAEATVAAMQESDFNYTANIKVYNTAKLTGNALQFATGNVQTNVAAGTGNQQNNSLAVAVNQGTPYHPGK